MAVRHGDCSAYALPSQNHWKNVDAFAEEVRGRARKVDPYLESSDNMRALYDAINTAILGISLDPSASSEVKHYLGNSFNAEPSAVTFIIPAGSSEVQAAEIKESLKTRVLGGSNFVRNRSFDIPGFLARIGLPREENQYDRQGKIIKMPAGSPGYAMFTDGLGNGALPIVNNCKKQDWSQQVLESIVRKAIEAGSNNGDDVSLCFALK